MVGFSIRRKRTSVAKAIEREAFEKERLKQARLTGVARAKEEARQKRAALKRRERAGSGSFAMGGKKIGMGLIEITKTVAKAQESQSRPRRKVAKSIYASKRKRNK